MENYIKQKKKIAKDTYLLDIHCPLIAKKAKAGNFVILRINEEGEKIPLTIADYDKTSITLVFKVVGHTTSLLANLRSGSRIADLRGPLGNPSELEGNGNICCVAGGVGIASIYTIMRELYKKGNTLITLLGAQSKDDLFWVDKLKSLSHRIMIATNDGSLGKKGDVTDILKIIMRRRLDFVYAVGPVGMMESVSKITWRMVRTRVSLNPVMIDGIGMCGGCRVKIGEDIRFACVDGPEFDAHEVDWKELGIRNNTFKNEEDHMRRKCGCKR